MDQALARRLPQFSRTSLKQWLQEGHIRGADGRQPLAATARVRAGDRVEIDLPPPPPTAVEAQNLPLRVVYADAAVLVVDKPAGLTVHPGAGCPDGTLQNALLYHAPDLAALPRAGLVHRLDKDTSGLLVVARTERARLDLIEQLKTRTMGREYLALVTGVPPLRGHVEAPIGRHPAARTKMAVTSRGRPARTDFDVVERFGKVSLLRLRLHSGRTHQIRVHMAHIGFPLVGDPVYGRPGPLRFGRQALHAARLRFRHPESGEDCVFEAEAPADFAALLAQLKGLP